MVTVLGVVVASTSPWPLPLPLYPPLPPCLLSLPPPAQGKGCRWRSGGWQADLMDQGVYQAPKCCGAWVRETDAQLGVGIRSATATISS
jgi:hypothetical protein